VVPFAYSYMYWLADFRATTPQDVIINLTYLFAWSFLGLSPWWMGLMIGVFNSLGGFKFQVQRVNEGAVAHRLPRVWQSSDIFVGAC